MVHASHDPHSPACSRRCDVAGVAAAGDLRRHYSRADAPTLPLGAMALVGLAAAALTGALPPGSRRHDGHSACLDTHRGVEYERKWNVVQVRRALEVSRP